MPGVSHMALIGSTRRALQVANPNSYTKFGDMTISGGLAGAFDGITVQVNTACAEKTANTGYVGLDLGTAFQIVKVVAYSASNTGFNGSGTATPAPTLSIRGSNVAVVTPSTDGVLLVSQVSNGVIADVVTLTSTDQTSYYRYVWAYVSGGSSGAISIAELQFTIKF